MEVDYFIAITSDKEIKKQLTELKQQIQTICLKVENEYQKPSFDWKVFEKELKGDKKEQINQLEEFIAGILLLKNKKEIELKNLISFANKNSQFYISKEKQINKEYLELKIVLQRLLLKTKVLIKEICIDLQNQIENTFKNDINQINIEKEFKLNQLINYKQNQIQILQLEEKNEIQRIKQLFNHKIHQIESEINLKKQKIELETQVQYENIEDNKRKLLTEISLRTQKLNELTKIENENDVIYSHVKMKDESFLEFQIQSNEYMKFIQFGGKKQIIENETQLTNWIGLNNSRLLFDSQTDGWERVLFNQLILGKEHLVFLHYTDKGDIFGCYIKQKIIKGNDIYDEDHFIFSLENHNRIISLMKWYKIKKMTFLKNWKVAFKIRDDEYFYSIGDDDILIQSSFDGMSRYSFNPICNYYKGITNDILTGDREPFKVSQLLVIQFY
ncbi:hypothetical protein KM1_271880 [Entamoeba histolytica HM-3:IMSS]|uniref:TLDc domain-containing protein n=1 Tax=Entamoeba histolytica HM-3:IMSS TaxID=885315 RepID=M7W3B3_ENTHI|nr:hypothetical protein KM1_271880 [Entamoeba histolytica HM-3:IMSS]